MRKVGWSDQQECGTLCGKKMYDFDITKFQRKFSRTKNQKFNEDKL
jgi:hypothetical protein